MFFRVLGISVAAVVAISGTITAQTASKLIDVVPQSAAGQSMFTYNGPQVNVADPNSGAGALITNPSLYKPTSVAGLLAPLNIGIATQLSALPIASPASGVILKSDATTGVALPSSLSLGPILTERAETIGRHKFYLGFTRQQFGFGTLENLNLGDFPTLYKGGDPSPILQGTSQRTTAPASFSTQVDLHIDQNVAFATFGLTDRIDVSAAIPVVHAFASATTFRGAIANTDVFAQAGGNCWCVQTFDVNNTNRLQAMNLPTSGHAQASATGIGDVMLRVKGTVLERRHASLALGSDLRLPTGDAKNYLGSGSTGWRPFAAVSLYTGELKPGLNISPHINVGYMVNGDSVLAGDPTTGQKDKLPNLLNFATGAEIGIGRSFTLVADYLGTSLFNSFRPIQISATGPKGELAQGVGLSPTRQSFTMSSGAFGFKVRVAKGLVLTSNTLVALDRKGLRDKWVPLFGLSYTFD